MVAIDCEMVLTAYGSQLARVTAVDERGAVLVDELVLPPHPITDYKTRYSGITERLLRGVTTTLAQARARLLSVVSADTIVVGHSLECDLRALKLVHRRVIDSAVVYPHPSGPLAKHALRFLTQQLLHRRIQGNAAAGHDSAEDARAALELVQLKVARGPDFGINQGFALVNLVELLQRSGRRCAAVDSAAANAEMAKLTNSASAAADFVSDWDGGDDDCASSAGAAVAGYAARHDEIDFVWANLSCAASLEEADPLVASVFDAMGPHSLLLTVAPFPDADDAERQARPQGEQRFGITMVRVK